jgi:hypothetical protein
MEKENKKYNLDKVYRIDILDIDSPRFHNLVKILDVNMFNYSQTLGYDPHYIANRIYNNLIKISDCVKLKQYVGDELFKLGLEKLALQEIAQKRNEGYEKRSNWQILRYIRDLTELVLDQRNELERVQVLVDNWDKDTKPKVKIKNFQLPEYVEFYDEVGLSDGAVNTFENWESLFRNIEAKDIVRFLKFIQQDQKGRVPLMTHYLKNKDYSGFMTCLMEMYYEDIESNAESKEKGKNEVMEKSNEETKPYNQLDLMSEIENLENQINTGEQVNSEKDLSIQNPIDDSIYETPINNSEEIENNSIL